MDTLSAEQAAVLLHLNVRRVQGLAREGKLPAARIGKKWLFRREELEALLGAPARSQTGRESLSLSTRNQLRGRIVRVTLDGLMAEVQLRVGDHDLVSLITRSSAERLHLEEGDEIYALVKATGVVIGKEETAPPA